jgi:4-phospho-D-threonate 3-dehydrogenase / 4-phospho-D-erythronate 3-dehydrogenase
MMTSREMTVSLVTTHVGYRQAASAVTKSKIIKVISITDIVMRKILGRKPAITICALNPHAGENGIMGMEEEKVIVPAVKMARLAGYNVKGPLPADTAFIPAVRRKTDAYIAMYHDQGLIPFKMLSFDTGVNVTLGLPIVRTSVDHGTACDIAHQGICSPESMVQAILLALKLAC